jgi:hypothetical protein
VQAGFLSYQHAGLPAAAVFTRNALQKVPDFWKAVAPDRIAGMLRPGGVLRLHDLIFDCQPGEIGAVIGRWLNGAAPRTATPARTMPSTSAPSSAPSAGCSSPCWPRPGSTS